MTPTRLALSFLFLASLLVPTAAPAKEPRAAADAKPLTRDASLAGFRYLVFETGHAKPGQSLPLIVGLHYSSAQPETMLGYFDSIDFPARVVLPQGAYPRRGGYSWFPSDYAQRSAAEQTAVTLRAEQTLSDFVAAAAAKYPTRGKPVVMGISYGGDLAFLLAIRHPNQFRASFPVAARFLPAWMPDRNRCQPHCPPIRAMHGDRDKTVPMAPTLDATKRLREMGFDVELQPYAGGTHDFDARMQRDFSAKARDFLAPTAPRPH